MTRETLATANGDAGGGFSDSHVEGLHLRVLTATLGPIGAVQVARSLEDSDRVLERLRRVLVVLVAVGTALAAGVSRLFSRRVVAPVTELTEAAEHIEATGDLGRRVDADGARRGRAHGGALQRDARAPADLAGPAAPARGRRLARAAHAGDLDAHQRRGAARRAGDGRGRPPRAARRRRRAGRGARRPRRRPHRAGPRRRGAARDRGRAPRRARGRGGRARAAPRARRGLHPARRALRGQRRARPHRARGQQPARQRRPARRSRRGHGQRRRRGRRARPRARRAARGRAAGLRSLLPRRRPRAGARARASAWPSCARSPSPTAAACASSRPRTAARASC